MIIGGVELISHRHHGGLWNMAAPPITAGRPSALPPQTIPQSATQQTPFTQRHGSRAESDLATKIKMGLLALFIPNLVLSTGLRVMAWGSYNVGSQEGSVPGSWAGPVEGGTFGSEDRMLDPYVVNGTVYGPQDV